MNNKIYTLIIILILIVTLIPLVYISRYNHPSADDYSYGSTTHKAWKETHSIINVLNESVKEVKRVYNEWQGTYSAIFLMTLQPSIFGEQYYCLTTILLISIFIFSNKYILKVILKDYLGCNNKIYLTMLVLIIIFSFQFLPYPEESLYWYNGSIYYTFFYSIMLFLIGNILKLIKEEKNRYFVSSILFAIFIAGGNYTTALISGLILSLIVILLLIKKIKKVLF